MSLIGIILFSFCFWCVFSRHFADGIIGKNLLSLGAISAFLLVVDPHNYVVLFGAVFLVSAGVLYSYYRPTRRRPLIGDRREKPRET